MIRLRGDVRSVRTLRARLRACEELLGESVEAIWADQLVAALVEIAEGKRSAESIARAALAKAGLPVQQRLTV